MTMKNSEIDIQQLQHSEIPRLKNFPPDEWHLDLPEFLLLHFGKPYFYPIVAKFNNQIVGTGCGILNGTAGWLGTIIVRPEFRRQGIGHTITEHLVTFFDRKDYSTKLLIATELGEPVYKKMGFKQSSTYVFYGADTCVLKPRGNNIRRIEDDDFKGIEALDRRTTGEERKHLLRLFYSTGWVHDTEGINGFFLPDFGAGLIIADSEEAGFDLLNVKYRTGSMTTVFPSENKTAKRFLEGQGFAKFLEVPRMVLGNELNWKPEYIYNRAAGYCG